MAQLSCQFRQHKVVCALSCAGNRRHTMRTLVKEVQGIDWGDGAVMNCEWKGPLLRDILTEAGLDIPDSDFDKGHVAFACYQTVCQQDSWYGSSIELRRAMREEAEIILALEVFATPPWFHVRVALIHVDERAEPSKKSRVSGAYYCTWIKWM